VNCRQHGGIHALLRCKVENIQLRDSVFWQLATFETSMILGAFAATINFVMFVRLFVRLEQLGSLWTICRENSSFVQIGQEYQGFT